MTLKLHELPKPKRVFYLRAQEFSLQAWVSKSEDPSSAQSSPPNSGSGLLQTRDLS